MQQILNYTPKVERIHHQYQGQGEVNKTLLYEDFYERAEQEKDKVLQTEPSDEKLIQNEKEGSSNMYNPSGKKKNKEENREVEEIEEEKEKKIDIKV